MKNKNRTQQNDSQTLWWCSIWGNCMSCLKIMHNVQSNKVEKQVCYLLSSLFHDRGVWKNACLPLYSALLASANATLLLALGSKFFIFRWLWIGEIFLLCSSYAQLVLLCGPYFIVTESTYELWACLAEAFSSTSVASSAITIIWIFQCHVYFTN